MSASRPPTLATVLLERLGPDNDALSGDLAEEFRLGRSRAWYWRQVGAAIVVSIVYELRDHKIVAFGTILIGWTLLWLGIDLVANPLSNTIRAWVLPHLVALRFRPFVGLWLYDIASCPPIAFTYVFAGWAARQLHRPTGSTVIAFALTVLLAGCVQSAAGIPSTPMPFVVSFVMWRTAFPTFFVLLGGLWAARDCSTDQTGVRA